MSVWISDEKLLIFASLISPSKMILFEKKYQTFDTVFHHQMKHFEVRQKYSAARRIFDSLLGVSCNMSKTRASALSRVPNTEKQMKARGRRPSAFICFSVFGTRHKALALVFDMSSQMKQEIMQ